MVFVAVVIKRYCKIRVLKRAKLLNKCSFPLHENIQSFVGCCRCFLRAALVLVLLYLQNNIKLGKPNVIERKEFIIAQVLCMCFVVVVEFGGRNESRSRKRKRDEIESRNRSESKSKSFPSTFGSRIVLNEHLSSLSLSFYFAGRQSNLAPSLA